MGANAEGTRWAASDTQAAHWSRRSTGSSATRSARSGIRPSTTATRMAWHHSTQASPATGSGWVRSETARARSVSAAGSSEERERDRRRTHQRAVAGRPAGALVQLPAAARARAADPGPVRSARRRGLGGSGCRRRRLPSPNQATHPSTTASRAASSARPTRSSHAGDHDGHLGVVAPLAGRVGTETAADHPRRLRRCQRRRAELVRHPQRVAAGGRQQGPVHPVGPAPAHAPALDDRAERGAHPSGTRRRAEGSVIDHLPRHHRHVPLRRAAGRRVRGRSPGLAVGAHAGPAAVRVDDEHDLAVRLLQAHHDTGAGVVTERQEARDSGREPDLPPDLRQVRVVGHLLRVEPGGRCVPEPLGRAPLSRREPGLHLLGAHGREVGALRRLQVVEAPRARWRSNQVTHEAAGGQVRVRLVGTVAADGCRSAPTHLRRVQPAALLRQERDDEPVRPRLAHHPQAGSGQQHDLPVVGTPAVHHPTSARGHREDSGRRKFSVATATSVVATHAPSSTTSSSITARLGDCCPRKHMTSRAGHARTRSCTSDGSDVTRCLRRTSPETSPRPGRPAGPPGRQRRPSPAARRGPPSDLPAPDRGRAAPRP